MTGTMTVTGSLKDFQIPSQMLPESPLAEWDFTHTTHQGQQYILKQLQ